MRGYFAIGIENTKTEVNIGTLWRSAYIFGAAFIFTINKKYEEQCSDTIKSWRHIPLYHYESFEEFYKVLPYDCRLIGIELIPEAIPIKNYIHPQRAIYLLGAEDNGLSKTAINMCHQVVVLPGKHSMNVSVAGSVVMFDRVNKD